MTFDLNYDGAPTVASAVTIGGRLINVQQPVRSGYTFGGLGGKHVRRSRNAHRALHGDTVSSENATLFALWTSTSQTGLAAPEVSVTSEGLRAALPQA